MEVLDNIPFSLEPGEVLRDSADREELRACVDELIEAVRPVARPKAVYKVSYVGDRGEDSVSIDGVTFTSRVLRINLDPVGRVFPYVATCGRELDEIALPPDDLMSSFFMDRIKIAVLRSASRYLQQHIVETYRLGQVSRMSPGSLEDWPITQQKELFSIFGDVRDLIGVELAESFLMVPLKSVSGILFPTEVRFESCQLCPREVCENRRAPYDPELAERYAVERRDCVPTTG